MIKIGANFLLRLSFLVVLC